MSLINKLASAVYNDIVSGLKGYHHNLSISIEQLEDDIVATRLNLIKQYSLKGILPIDELVESINCIPIDCQDLDRCSCNSDYVGEPQLHFQIPAVMVDVFGQDAIKYIGSTDRRQPFTIYSSPYEVNYVQKYRKRGKKRPWVFLDPVQNIQGMIDGYVFNAPMLKEISIVAIFKDPRDLDNFKCCETEETNKKFSFLDKEIKNAVADQYIKYYRSLAMPIMPNKQEYVV